MGIIGTVAPKEEEKGRAEDLGRVDGEAKEKESVWRIIGPESIWVDRRKVWIRVPDQEDTLE